MMVMFDGVVSSNNDHERRKETNKRNCEFLKHET